MSESTVKTQGQVKWFNNKSGYGFISVKIGDETKDIFAHYSNITLNDSQYKYLTQGEYVEFEMSKLEEKKEGSDHEFQAINITGIDGGPIMCEIRRQNREARGPISERTSEYKPRPRRQRRETDDEGFNTVRRSVSRR